MSSTQQQSTTRRQHVVDDILEKSGRLFDSRGYGETSLQDIADAVGIARPSLYHYFSSKEEILVTIVERTIRVRDETVRRVREMDGDPRERLRTILIELGLSTSTNPAGLRLVLNASGALPTELRRRDLRSRRTMFELLSDVVGDGIDAGRFRPSDERSTAATIIAALTGLQYEAIGGVSMTPANATEQLVDLLLSGICRGADRGPTNLDEALATVYEDLQTLERHARSTRHTAIPARDTSETA